MSPEAKAVEEALLALDPDERAAVIERVQDSLDDSELSPEWQAEIARRLASYRRGDVELLYVDEHFAHIEAKLEAGDFDPARSRTA